MFKRGIIAAACCAALAAAESNPKPKSAPRPARLHIHSATLVTGAGIPVQLQDLRAELPPKQQQPRPTLIYSGSAFLTADSLTKLIQSRLSGDGIENLEIDTMPGQRAKISGKMKKAGIPIPVSIEGPVSLTQNGMLRLEVQSKKAGILPMDAIGKLFGFDLSESVPNNRAVRFEKDALIVDPRELLGTTAQGRVTQVLTTDRGITLRFGAPAQR
jgi:hypothetical protein